MGVRARNSVGLTTHTAGQGFPPSVTCIDGAGGVKIEDAGAFWSCSLFGGGGLTSPLVVGYSLQVTSGIFGNVATGAPYALGVAAAPVNISGGPGTITPSAAQLGAPMMVVIGTPGGNNILALPAVVGQEYVLDFTGCVLGVNHVTVTMNGNAWGTLIVAANQAHLFRLVLGNDGKPHGWTSSE